MSGWHYRQRSTEQIEVQPLTEVEKRCVKRVLTPLHEDKEDDGIFFLDELELCEIPPNSPDLPTEDQSDIVIEEDYEDPIISRPTSPVRIKIPVLSPILSPIISPIMSPTSQISPVNSPPLSPPRKVQFSPPSTPIKSPTTPKRRVSEVKNKILSSPRKAKHATIVKPLSKDSVRKSQGSIVPWSFTVPKRCSSFLLLNTVSKVNLFNEK